MNRMLAVLAYACACGSLMLAQADRAATFKVIGYYSLRAAMSADLSTVPFDKLTHVNLSFLNPDAEGLFPQDYSTLAPFVEAAHRQRVKVLASIGGGGRHQVYRDVLADDRRA